jgi:putative transposase
MVRQARLVVPGHPHHVTQRGNRRLPVFFSDDDYRAYLDLLSEWSAKSGTAVWSYCLMPNHVHLILVPRTEDGLRATLGETHRRYTRMINFREGWRGHLWQERFHSFPMDEEWLMHAARYVALNPVAAGLVARPEDWPWSSASAHLTGKSDGIVDVRPLVDRGGDWAAFMEGGIEDAMVKRLEMHMQTGRPLGSDTWIEALEARLGRSLRPRKRGPKGRGTAQFNN